MKENIENPFYKYELPNEKLKREIESKLQSLTEKNVSLTDIARLFNAENLLEYTKPSGKHSSIIRLNAERFVKGLVERKIKINLPEEYLKIDEVILPPSEIEIKSGSGAGYKEKGIIPRSTSLMEVLTVMGLKYSITEGKNDPNMARKLSYLIFSLPELQKSVLVNDEEGNATYIVHNSVGEDWKKYTRMTKEELLEMSGNLVSSVIYPNKNKEGHQQRWKDKIKELLTIKPEQLLALKGAEIDYPKSETETGLIPEGWKLLKNLTIEYNSDKATLKKYIDKYRSTNPEWFKRYRHPSKGAYREYLSPELCDTINKEFPGHPPFGWLTLTALAKEVKVATNTVRNLIEKYRENNPSWFQGYRHEKALRREYLHPELVSIVKDNFKEIAFDKKGWITAHSLSQSRRVNISDTTIRLIIKKYRAQHPEWFKMLRNKKGNEREHYSPELVEKLINEYSIPEGWMIIADISKILGIISYKTIHKRLNKYRSTNPEWFRIYKDSGERQHECYAPKLVEIIKKD